VVADVSPSAPPPSPSSPPQAAPAASAAAATAASAARPLIARDGSGGSPRRPGPADEPLLHHGRHQRAVPGEHEAPGQPATAAGVGAVLGVEQPVVGPERPVEPHGVVEAGHE